MSIGKINDYAVGDTNFTSFMETLDATRRGLAQITISEYDTDSAPSVKVGSVFDNQGAFYQVTSADETPTGYSGISVSTTFYLYLDVSALAFIYSSTAPTWSDLYQGWYNGDDRAFFSMYKDSGGTLYTIKYRLASPTVRPKYYYKDTSVQIQEVYNSISGWVPNLNDVMPVSGITYNGTGTTAPLRPFYIYRSSSTSITVRGDLTKAGSSTTLSINSTATQVLESFHIESNIDAITVT